MPWKQVDRNVRVINPGVGFYMSADWVDGVIAELWHQGIVAYIEKKERGAHNALRAKEKARRQ